MLSEQVAARVLELDGVWDTKSDGLSAALKSLHFATPLFRADVVADGIGDEGMEKFLEETATLRDTHPAAFRGALAGFLESNGHSWHFRWTQQYSPFGPDAWSDHGDEAEMRALVAGDTLDFLVFCYSTGFPDHWMVCLSDPNPANPTVYGTDHEEWFDHVVSNGTLLDFFAQLRTPMQILEGHSQGAP